MGLALLRHQWQTDRASLLGWSALVAAVTASVVLAMRALAGSDFMVELSRMIEAMPPAVRALVGNGGLLSLRGFVAGPSTLFALMLFTVFTALYVPGLISLEADQGSLEFLLALPVRRVALVAERWLSLVLNLAVLVSVWCAAFAIAMGADRGGLSILPTGLNMLAIMTVVGSLMFVVSVFINDHALAMTVCGVAGTALFALNLFVEQSQGVMRTVLSYLPYARIDAQATLLGGTWPVRDLAYLGSVSLALFVAAAGAFERKQISL